MKCWEGLGYYRRAHNLKKTASLIIENSMEGYREILKTLILYLELESILQAQLYIAFDQKFIPLDGNVERVLKRVLFLRKENDISKQNLQISKNFLAHQREQAIMRKLLWN